MELGETNDIKFRIGKKEYFINKLPIILAGVIIFIISEIMYRIVFNNAIANMNSDINIYMGTGKFQIVYLTIIILAILKYIADFSFRSKVDLLIINQEEKRVQLLQEKIHHVGDSNWGDSWISKENFYVENIEGVYESLFSFVIYGKVNFTKTQKNGTIKKINREKLVIKKIFEKNEEIRECLNEITNTKSE